MYIRAIELTDLRAFGRARLEFLYPGRKLARDPFEDSQRAELDDPSRFGNVNVVLGVNGSGKSTVLDAIAIAVNSPIPQSGFVPNALIRKSNHGTPHRAKIVLDLILHPHDFGATSGKARTGRLECTVKRLGDHEIVEGPPDGETRFSKLFIDRSAAFTLLGYGVFRRVEALNQSELISSRQKRRSHRYDRVASLFEDDVPLIPLSSWFSTIHDVARRQEVVDLINKVTPKTVRFEGRIGDDGEMRFQYRKLELPFSALSDGYRGHLGWVGDLLYRLNDVAPTGVKLADVPGVVLVDEIDAHLHPAWQQDIIGALSRAFPKLQFIFTTHSPLITGTLERAHINVVTRAGSGPPRVAPPTMEMYGLSADQILLTDLFGLKSTRDAQFTAELETLRRAAATGGAEVSHKLMRKAALGRAADFADASGDSEAPDWLVEMAGRSE